MVFVICYSSEMLSVLRLSTKHILRMAMIAGLRLDNAHRTPYTRLDVSEESLLSVKCNIPAGALLPLYCTYLHRHTSSMFTAGECQKNLAGFMPSFPRTAKRCKTL